MDIQTTSISLQAVTVCSLTPQEFSESTPLNIHRNITPRSVENWVNVVFGGPAIGDERSLLRKVNAREGYKMSIVGRELQQDDAF